MSFGVQSSHLYCHLERDKAVGFFFFFNYTVFKDKRKLRAEELMLLNCGIGEDS